MRFSFEDSKHLVSLLVLLVFAIGAFVLLRAAVVPQGFGQYGHYRGGAIADNRARAASYSGQSDCLICHDPEATERNAGRHKTISCEACHGPQATHVATDGKVKPPKPDVKSLCRNCQEKDAARPAWLPQVVLADHNAGMVCNECHQPHQPKM